MRLRRMGAIRTVSGLTRVLTMRRVEDWRGTGEAESGKGWPTVKGRFFSGPVLFVKPLLQALRMRQVRVLA